MTTDIFNKVIDDQIEKCRSVLIGKAKEYADNENDDRLHNFKNAGGMMSESPRSALAGMMAKHTISIYDMCKSDDDFSIAQWEEKIGDHINYLLLLKAVVVEEKLEKHGGLNNE